MKSARFVGSAPVWLIAAITTSVASAASNGAIRSQVQKELRNDQALSSASIVTQVQDGVVTLSGTVDNLLAKRRSARIGEAVKGVRAVVNRLTVRPYANLGDDAIRRSIDAAFISDPATESYEVDATVSGGRVTLTGRVDSWQERRLAEVVAAGVRGVTGIENRITVYYPDDRPDLEIRSEIERLLKWSAFVRNPEQIDVQVDGGRVTLTGKVASAAERREAYRLAGVAGVETVNYDDLEVDEGLTTGDWRRYNSRNLTNAQVERAVEDALLYDPRVASYVVSAHADNGVVTLRGTVNNLKAKRAAAQDARNTVGVSQVVNRLRVAVDRKSDEDLERDVEMAMARDSYVESYDVDVVVHNGVASLFGTVDTHFEKWQADDAAARVSGVWSVDNNLFVNNQDRYSYDPYVDDDYVYAYSWYEAEPQNPTGNDRQIEENITDQFWWSPFVNGDQVHVDVRDGVAYLTGTVSTWSEKQSAAENAIEGGAASVINNITVHYGT